MFCITCGKATSKSQKFCTGCGASVPSVPAENSVHQPSASVTEPKKFSAGTIFTIVIVVTVIGLGIYGSQNDDAINANNEALSNVNIGNTQEAISQLQRATEQATEEETKLHTLKNLGYVYDGEGQTSQALNTFQEALALTEQGSFDYHLVSGEIAALQGNSHTAYSSYMKAYQMNPNDYQINNSLAIFHLNVDDEALSYENYPKALSYAQKAYSLDPQEIARQNLGMAHYFNENFDQAISLMSQTNLEQHPYMAIWLGLAYLAKEDHASARFYFQKAVAAGVDVPPEVYEYLSDN